MRALIVEDNETWQQILHELLTDSGFEVQIVANLADAQACLRAATHRLVVVDLALGSGDSDNVDGLQVLEAVRRLDPACASIMLTGLATVELAVSVLTEYGALSCLRKEAFDRAEFRGLLNRVLTLAQPFDEDAAPVSGVMSDDARLGGAFPVLPSVKPAAATVLVVDDDAGWRNILAELLIDAGYQARVCSSFGEALGYLRRETYLLAVIDLSLHGAFAGGHGPDPLDGYALLAEARAREIPALVVSGHSTPAEIDRAYSEGEVFAYLEKQTFNRRAFLQAIAELRSHALSDSILAALTRREREVLSLLVLGLTNKEIAQSLVITANTVKRHLKAVFGKLEVHNRSAAVSKALSLGFVAKPE